MFLAYVLNEIHSGCPPSLKYKSYKNSVGGKILYATWTSRESLKNGDWFCGLTPTSEL